MTPAAPRAAIVHERFTELGGSELVVAHFHAGYPDAPVHTTVVDPTVVPEALGGADLRAASHLRRLYRGGTGYAHLLPLLPGAMRSIDFAPDVEVVLISHHAFANQSVRAVPRGAETVSYVHTPARWMWEPAFLSNEIGGRIGRAGLGAFARWQRRSDRAAAAAITRILANSTHVAGRIERYWGREAIVVHPPIDTEWFHPDPAEASGDGQPFFLYAGRLVPYKRPDVAVRAAVRAGVRLVVAGGGRWLPHIRSLAEGHPNVEVRGPVALEELRRLLRTTTALVFPGEEDFGMVPVEAQACGTPVIALGTGGVLDSVVDGTTGVLYRAGEGPDGDVAALAEAMRTFDRARFDSSAIRHHAQSFSAARFRQQLAEQVERARAGERTKGVEHHSR